MKSVATTTDRSQELLLGEIAEEFTRRLGRGEQPAIEDYVGKYPELGELIRQTFPALQLMSGMETTCNLEDGKRKTEDPSGCLGDYRIKREIGRGGMGVVYEAEQISLKRKVALKILPLAAVLDQRQLQRFRTEAQAAAALHHQNIVPVHGVGCERGVHYYSMQYIEGQSLTEVIDDLRGTDGYPIAPGDTSPTSSIDTKQDVQALLSTERSTNSVAYFRTVAELGIQVAGALEYAHQEGIIHRDIKPSNLILDPRGKLWVTDFGLCRVENQPEITVTGDLVGTLRYMSPEQTLAKRTLVDHRTDIYSLGATLYELLTLQPLFTSTDRHELIRQIALEDPRSPRHRNRAIPVDLETVVLKAIAKNPADRYFTAQQLAEDLERFASGKSVQARRIGSPERLWRWSKRNPMVALLSSAVATLATLVAIVTSIGYAKTTVALAEAQHQSQLADEQRARADRQFHAARAAVDRMLTTVATELVNVPNSGAVRRKLLEDALEFYEGFLQQKRTDPFIRHETALAYKRVGQICRSLGDQAGALKAYSESIKLLERLVEEFPKEGAYLYALVRSTNGQAHVETFNDVEASIRTRQRHLALCQQLVAEHPARPKYRKELAWGHAILGQMLAIANRLPEALSHGRQAVDEWEKLYQEHPQLPQDLLKLALIHHWVGSVLLKEQQLSEAEKHLCQSHTLRKQLLEADPNSREIRYHLAHIKQYLAKLRHAQGRLVQAEDLSMQAIAMNEQLVEEYPADIDYRRRLSRTLHNLDRRLVESGRGEEAEPYFQTMINHREALIAMAPDDSLAVRELALAYFRLGLRRYLVDKQDQEATSNFRRTQQLYETFLKEHADDHRIEKMLASFLASCPAAEFQQPTRALGLVKSLLRDSPAQGDLWGILGAAYHTAGEWKKATDAFDRANSLHEEDKSADLFPLAMSQWHLGFQEKACQSYDQAVESMKQPRLSNPELLRILRSKAEELMEIAFRHWQEINQSHEEK